MTGNAFLTSGSSASLHRKQREMKCTHLIVLLNSAGLVCPHSWVVKVGLLGGKSRGGSVGDDLTLQRYFCPLPLLDDCQPDAKHGITLTDDALRPCRAGVESSTRASVRAGDSLFVSWMGNGHVNNNGQSDGSCVKFLLAPYESDPDFGSFSTISGGECVDYWYTNSEGYEKTDHLITIPADTPPGKYTMLWYWDFTEFWYSSCSDIDVLPASGTPTAPTTSAPAGSPTSQTNAPQTSPPTLSSADMQSYQENGCNQFGNPDSFCISYLGSSSYCKDWQLDACGRAVCHGGDFLLPCSPSSPTAAPVSSPTGESTPIDAYRAGGCTGASVPADFCTSYFGGGSYCKGWGVDGCARAVCQGDAHSSLDPCP